MKFPYISVEPIVFEAQGDVKTLMKTSSFTTEDCYTWAIDVAREIGGFNYDSDSTEIQIKKHTGHLPKDFYLLESIWLCRHELDGCAAKEPVLPSAHNRISPYIRTTAFRPADSATRRLCKPNCCGVVSEQNFTLKVPPGIIRTSLPTAMVSIDYLKVPMENGIVLVQDEINGIKAIKNYIKMMLIHETWLMGQVRGDVYSEIKGEYETYLRLAQQQQKAPDASETEFKTIEQDQRYRNFRYRYQ